MDMDVDVTCTMNDPADEEVRRLLNGKTRRGRDSQYTGDATLATQRKLYASWRDVAAGVGFSVAMAVMSSTRSLMLLSYTILPCSIVRLHCKNSLKALSLNCLRVTL